MLSFMSSSNSKLLGDYQLGDSLGKGAFGQVYRALNWTTGETVAVKEIQLSNIPKGELSEIMSEINLLKNLDHPNIVKYKGFKKEREHLYIILEFCENGSLHNISKRFGKFPENLVAVYISQVLEGLVYLHDQGVIHRDIKGANILTNKDGCVKLADFGVASKATAGAVSDAAVVGSPYWMAPEVIEQSGATTASDIWSVGCTIIELLEGKPPFHFLDPMPALFRIVQDDCPPIPEGASPIVKDFLYHCFQKDANLRISAKKLLRHPWMVSTRKQMGIGEKEAGEGKEADVYAGDPRRPLSNYNYDEAVLKVQEWNEALRSPSRPSKNPTRARLTTSPPDSPTETQFATTTGMGGQLSASASAGSQPTITPLWKPGTSVNGKAPVLNGPRGVVVLQPPEEQTDNWDDDFEEGISLSKLQGLSLEKGSPDEDRDENVQTLRPTRSPRGRTPPPLVKTPPQTIGPIVEDYSDLLVDDDDETLQQKIAGFKAKNTSRRPLYHPNDIKTFGLGNISPGPKTAPLPEPGKKSSQTRMSPLMSPGVLPGPSLSRSHSRSSSFVGSSSGSFGRSEGRRMASQGDFDKYAEMDDEDYDDVFGKPNGASSDAPVQTLQLNTRLSNKSWLGDEDNDEEDPFAEIEEDFPEDDLDANLQRDKYARLCNTVTHLIDELTPSAPDSQLRDACNQLLSILNDVPEMQEQMVSSHGMLAILEVLEGTCSREVTLRLLQIVNVLVTADMGFLESFCLIGGIPVIMGFTSKKHPAECRLEASNFIRLLCHSSVLTLQMFISCRGLKVLVDLLDEDYTEHTDLVIHALNGIGSVFELQSPTKKNDFCRMFIREGLLDPLSSALLNVMATSGDVAAEMKGKIIQIILVFCQVSVSDIHVRNALGTRKVIRRFLRACELLQQEYLVQMLKAVKHLSMNATLLDVLQNANAIEILCRVSDEQSSGPHSTEVSNHVFQTCYNLCRLNKSRQEEAAQAGIIPSLKRVIESSSPLKQFALPILCDLASAGKSCRILLWQHNGLSMYLKLLSDPYFQVSALESIVSWLQDETARVEDRLMESTAIDALLQCFTTAKANSFENLLDPFLKICRLSTPVTIALAKAAFFKRIITKLSHSKPVVRLNLLKLLRMVCDVHPNRVILVERYGIYEIVERLSKEDGAVLVRELARDIMPALAPALKPGRSASGGRSSGRNVETAAGSGSGGLVGSPKATITVKKSRIRRTASEAAIGAPGSTLTGPALPTSGRQREQGMERSGSDLLRTRTRTRPSSRLRLNDISWQQDGS